MAEPAVKSSGDDALAPRKLALLMLEDVARADLGDGVERQLAQSKLPPRDKAFAMRLAMQVLRTQKLADAILAHFLKTPIDMERAAFVQRVLRMGVAQLLWLGTAPHAAVHSSVELIKQSRFKGLSGMANAVLKRIANEGADYLATLDQPRILLPDWIWQSWCGHYGEETTRELAMSLLNEPPLDLTVKENAAEWAEKLGAVLLPTGSLRLENGGQVNALEGFDAGAWWVQDAAAALPAKLLLSAIETKNPTLLDLCAAPGGKTAQLAASGAKVIAVDRSKRRMERMGRNLKRLKLADNVEQIVANLLEWEPKEKVDGILLDAPCTATGTFRRQPEVLINKSPVEVAELAALQRAILLRALEWLKPGGVLVYATCSLENPEGGAHMDEVAKRSDVTLVPVLPGEMPDCAVSISSEGALRTLPIHWKEKGGMDGFFAFRVRKL